MTKQPKPKDADTELRPDGWERFEAAVDAATTQRPASAKNPASGPAGHIAPPTAQTKRPSSAR